MKISMVNKYAMLSITLLNANGAGAIGIGEFLSRFLPGYSIQPFKEQFEEIERDSQGNKAAEYVMNALRVECEKSKRKSTFLWSVLGRLSHEECLRMAAELEYARCALSPASEYFARSATIMGANAWFPLSSEKPLKGLTTAEKAPLHRYGYYSSKGKDDARIGTEYGLALAKKNSSFFNAKTGRYEWEEMESVLYYPGGLA